MMPQNRTALDLEIRRRIALSGPMPVAEFMALCLYDPEHGYYNQREPFGVAGDFVTAPEISQMFGELIGLWAATVWQSMGAPDPVQFVELGPGRGTLMADALRAVRTVPEFRKSAHIHLVETSPQLQLRQRETLSAVDDVQLRWHASFAEVPDGPAIVIANEFFDALPIRQAERCGDGWHERVITVNAGGELAFTVAAEPLADFEPTLPPAVRTAAVGKIFEWRPDHPAADIARRIAANGIALVIDYGHVKSGVGDTFQAVRSHRYASPLALPGQTDLTAHVDFEALGGVAAAAGARIHGPVDQSVLLKRLGIAERAAALQAVAPEDKQAGIALALERLTGTGPANMGSLFKAMAMAAPQVPTPPGFEP